MRRPIRSANQENDTQPRNPTTVSRSIILEASCGVTFQAEEDIPRAGYDIDENGAVNRSDPTQTDPNNSSYAEQAMVNFKAKNITTVIWASGTDDLTSKAASKLRKCAKVTA